MENKNNVYVAKRGDKKKHMLFSSNKVHCRERMPVKERYFKGNYNCLSSSVVVLINFLKAVTKV